MKEFQAHWECLENNNHHLFECRKAEMSLNSCVFDKLVRNSRLYTWVFPIISSLDWGRTRDRIVPRVYEL